MPGRKKKGRVESGPLHDKAGDPIGQSSRPRSVCLLGVIFFADLADEGFPTVTVTGRESLGLEMEREENSRHDQPVGDRDIPANRRTKKGVGHDREND
jgi:hypothetical protein